MKIKKLGWIVLLGLCVISCHDLTLEPKGVLGETELFGSESGVKMYFAGLYGYLPIEDFAYMARNEDGYRKNEGDDPWGTWEAMKYYLQNMSGEFVNSWQQVNNDGPDYWPYDRIREVNSFIRSFPDYEDNFSSNETYNSLLGEAHFLRAYFYFGLAKRYGGVPIVTEVQDPLDDLQKLAVSRNTEYDTWKFIHDDLQFAIDHMSSDTKDATRANKYTAAALMSRAMLYAGTIAKYSQYLGFENESAYQQGFAGIDPSKANEFFQYSYDAGKIVELGGYALYTANYPDKATNFANLFLDKGSSENIFIKSYSVTAPEKTYLLGHTWDAGMSPSPSMSSFVGSQSYPALDLMQMYDFPDIIDAEGYPKRFSARSDIREGMEPRMRGCMYFSGDELRGSTFAIQRGLYRSFPWKASEVEDGIDTEGPNLNGNRIVSSAGARDERYTDPDTGKEYLILSEHGMRNNQGGENNCLTGAFVRKYVNPDMPLSDVREHRSQQHWVVFRLGEIYLNTAEAAYELGMKTEAFDYIEKIRLRAGCNVTRPVDDATDLSAEYGYPIDGNLQFIRDERYRELWGENHRWWDLRRWRVADRVLNRWIPRILSCYYVIDEDKYIYLDEREMSSRTWTAERKSYYQGIPQGEINKNSNLLPQNPLR